MKQLVFLFALPEICRHRRPQFDHWFESYEHSLGTLKNPRVCHLFNAQHVTVIMKSFHATAPDGIDLNWCLLGFMVQQGNFDLAQLCKRAQQTLE